MNKRKKTKGQTKIFKTYTYKIMIYQHLITITEDMVKYAGEINYQLKFVVQQNLVFLQYI
jgi:hypothetical protein